MLSGFKYHSTVNNMIASLVVLALTVTCGLGVNKFGIGQCPSPKTEPEFKLEKFAGIWYEIESTASIDNFARKCSTFIVETKGKNKASLLHKFYSSVSNKQKSEFSEITTPKSSEPGKLNVKPLKGVVMGKQWPLWIIDTDYETYAVGYSCKKKMVTFTEDVYILARTRELSDKQKMDIYELLKKNDISQKLLTEVDQTDKECTKESKE